MKTTLTYSALLLCLSILLSGCQTIGDHEPDRAATPTEQQQAETLESQGDYRGAAEQWLRLANKTPVLKTQQRDTFLLRASSDFLQVGDALKAGQALASVSQQSLPRWQLNQARLQLLLNKPTATLAILDKLPTDNLAIPDLKQHLQLQAKAYSLSGNHIEAARKRVELDALIDDAINQDANHTRLWAELNQLSVRALASIYAVTAPGHFRDWLELAILTLQAKKVGGTVQLEAWQRKHPLHPAVSRFLATLKKIETSTTPTPAKIALLLPLDGRIAEPAKAIRDGFLSAFYQDKRKQTDTSITVYTANASNIDQVYQQAVTEGADFIVGPLDKASVKQLSLRTDIRVPTLMLNASDDISVAQTRLYQFALLPEDEARQAAERMVLEEHHQGIILYPESRWGERVSSAFQQHWQQLGGTIVDAQSFSLKSRDFAQPVRRVLHIDDSKKRFRQLRNIIGGKLEFEPRRRKDIDFIFLAAFPEQARQIRPQLKFYDASNVAVYATSHVYSGTVNPQRDRDMNGIIFSDMPWTISSTQAGLKNRLAQLWPGRSEKFTRFYAFGIDAYRVIPHLQRLQQYPYERYMGMTGTLRLDEQLRLMRQLSWAKFRAGKPVANPVVNKLGTAVPPDKQPIPSGPLKPGA